MSNGSPFHPTISVVVLNYNGEAWLRRCFESLESQTNFADIEVIVVDNNSPDGSARFADEWVRKVGRGKVLKNKVNLYFCEGNNVGAAAASGRYLFFLNNDTWLEPDCLERLIRETEAAGADAATPLVVDYDNNSYQSLGAPGLDLFGLTKGFSSDFRETREIFAACGCTYFVKADMFEKVGGFDARFLMYSDEIDLSWRVQIAGGKIVGVPSARVHHRGAVTANPEGKTKVVESRTSDTKRFLSNRNGILTIMKNAQHVLLFLLVTHLVLLFLEALAGLLLIRRWSYVKKCYFGAVIEAFRMMDHVRDCRHRIGLFRRRNDFWMLRFICLVPSRWDEVRRLKRFGVPKVEAK